MDRPTPAELIAIIQAHGSDATTLRDAAHEAHHALEAGVRPGKWDRETINRALERNGPGRAVASEIMARAVEQIVCADLGTDPGGDVEKWAYITCLEAIKRSGISLPSVQWVVERVREKMGSPAGRKAADAVLALWMPSTRRGRAA